MATFAVLTVGVAGLYAADATVSVSKTVDAETVRSRVPQLTKLSARWEQVMKARGLSGMAVVVVQGNEVIFSKTLGERDPEEHLPV